MTIQKILLEFEPKKENLLRAIKQINSQLGKFDYEAAKLTSDYFGLSQAQVYSAASFYDQIETSQVPGLVIKVCDSVNCQSRHSDQIIRQLENFFGQKIGEDSSRVRIETISCLGRCLEGPIVEINGTIYEKMDPVKVIEILRGYI